jgi:hypothetical protein
LDADPEAVLGALGTTIGGGFPVVMFDGSVRLLSAQATASDAALLFDHRDGAPVNHDLLLRY